MTRKSLLGRIGWKVAGCEAHRLDHVRTCAPCVHRTRRLHFWRLVIPMVTPMTTIRKMQAAYAVAALGTLTAYLLGGGTWFLVPTACFTLALVAILFPERPRTPECGRPGCRSNVRRHGHTTPKAR